MSEPLSPRAPRSFVRTVRRACMSLSLLAAAGCSTITGTLTGPFTGFVDLPREIMHEQHMRPDAASTWVVALFAAPVGAACGPVFGFVKGIALDINAMNGTLSTAEEFGTMNRASVWRPYAFDWQQSRPAGQ
ncbi:MAG: hypothetical protein R3F29_01180 [Planctomycetota bacterium]